MTTLEQRELAALSSVNEQPLPSKSKFDLDKEKDQTRLEHDEIRDLRKLESSIIPYRNELSDTLWNPRDKIMEELKWDPRSIPEDEYLHIPHRKAA